MITGIIITALVGAVVGIVQELRRRNAALELDQWREKYKELSKSSAEGTANASDREQRLAGTLTQFRAEIARLRAERTVYHDPDAVHDRLTKLLSLGQAPVTGQAGPAKARVPAGVTASPPVNPARK